MLIASKQLRRLPWTWLAITGLCCLWAGAKSLPAGERTKPSVRPASFGRGTPPETQRFPAQGVLLPGGEQSPNSTLTAEQPSPMDLGTAFALAGLENPEILVALQRTLSATARQQYAAAQILPNLNLGTNFDLHRGVLQQASGNILSVNRDALYIGGGANAVAAGSVNIPGVQYNLNVGESLFRFYTERQRTQAVAHLQDAVRNRVMLIVAAAYIDLVRAQALRSVAIEIRQAAQEIADLTAAYAETGQGRQADAERAATVLALREVDLMQAELQVAVASARLVEVLNLNVTTRLHATDNWLVPHPAVPELISRRELLAIAVMQRPELHARQAEVTAALTALQGAKLLPFSPQLMFGLSSGLFGGGSNLIASDTSVSGAASNQPRFGNFDGRGDLDVVMYWSSRNLGYGNRAIIDEAAAHWQEADLEFLKTMNRVQREVVDAQVRTQVSFSKINLHEKAARSARQAHQQDLARIRANEGLPIEVLDSLRLLRKAQQDYVETITTYNKAHFELYTAIGGPPADMLARPVPVEPAPAAEPE